MAVELLSNIQNRARETGGRVAEGARMGAFVVFALSMYTLSEFYYGIWGRFNRAVREEYMIGMSGSVFLSGERDSGWNLATLLWTPDQRVEANSAVADALRVHQLVSERVDRWLNEAEPEGVLDEVARNMIQIFRSVGGQKNG